MAKKEAKWFRLATYATTFGFLSMWGAVLILKGMNDMYLDAPKLTYYNIMSMWGILLGIFVPYLVSLGMIKIDTQSN